VRSQPGTQEVGVSHSSTAVSRSVTCPCKLDVPDPFGGAVQIPGRPATPARNGTYVRASVSGSPGSACTASSPGWAGAVAGLGRGPALAGARWRRGCAAGRWIRCRSCPVVKMLMRVSARGRGRRVRPRRRGRPSGGLRRCVRGGSGPRSGSAARGQGGGEVGGGLLVGGFGEVVVAEEAGGEALEGHRPVRKGRVGLAGGVRSDDGVVGGHLNVGGDVGVEGGVDPVRLRRRI
jgi:hypothetical protein